MQQGSSAWVARSYLFGMACIGLRSWQRDFAEISRGRGGISNRECVRFDQQLDQSTIFLEHGAERTHIRHASASDEHRENKCRRENERFTPTCQQGDSA